MFFVRRFTQGQSEIRIVLTPQHAKRLKATGENIHRFELAHMKLKTQNNLQFRLISVPRDKHNFQKRLQKWSLFML
jgi:hypothetical protein